MTKIELIDQRCQELYKNAEGLNERAKVLGNFMVQGEDTPRQLVIDVEFSESPIEDDAEAIEKVTDAQQQRCIESILMGSALKGEGLPKQISLSFRFSEKKEAELISAEPWDSRECDEENRSITRVEVVVATEDGMRNFDTYVHMFGPFNPGLIYYWLRSDEFEEQVCSFALSREVAETNEIGLFAPDHDILHKKLMEDDSPGTTFPKWLYARFEKEGWNDELIMGIAEDAEEEEE